MNIAAPVLKPFGVDLEGKYTEETDEASRHIEEAASALNDTTKKFSSAP